MQLVAYLGAILGVLFIGCGAVVYLETNRPEGYNSQVTYAIITMCTTILAVLLGNIKSIGNGAKLDRLEVKADEAKVAANEAKFQAAEVVQTVQAIPDITARKIRTGNGPGEPGIPTR